MRFKGKLPSTLVFLFAAAICFSLSTASPVAANPLQLAREMKRVALQPAWLTLAYPRTASELNSENTSLAIEVLNRATKHSASRLRVAVIDTFYADIKGDPLATADARDLDADGVAEPVSHGDLICLFLRHPMIECVPLPITSLKKAKSDIANYR